MLTQAAFLRGTLAPDLRASLMPIAIACLRLFTLRWPRDFNLPCLYSCMTLPTFFPALRLYLRCPLLLELLDEAERDRVDFFLAVVPRCPVLLRLELAVLRRFVAVLLRPAVLLADRPLLELDFLAVAINT